MSNNIMFVDCVDKVLLQEMPRKIAAREKSFQSMLEQYYKPKSKIEKMEDFLDLLSWEDMPRNFEDSRAIKLRKKNMENALINSDAINAEISQRNESQDTNSLENGNNEIEPISYDVNESISSESDSKIDESVTYSEDSADEIVDETSNDLSGEEIVQSIEDVPVSDVTVSEQSDLVSNENISVDDFDNDNTEEVDGTIDITVPNIEDKESIDTVTYSESNEDLEDNQTNIFDTSDLEENIRLPRGGNAAKIENYDENLEENRIVFKAPSFNDILVKNSYAEIPRSTDKFGPPIFKSAVVEDIDTSSVDRDVPIVVDDRDDNKTDYTVSFNDDDSNKMDTSDRKRILETLKEKLQRLEAEKIKVKDAIELSKQEEKAREESDMAVEDRLVELKKIVSAVDDTYEAKLEERRMYEAKITEDRRAIEENDQNIREMDSFIEEYSTAFRR